MPDSWFVPSGLFRQTHTCISVFDVEAEDIISTAFGANLPRLVAIKKNYDPTNFFCVNHNMKPRSQAGAA